MLKFKKKERKIIELLADINPSVYNYDKAVEESTEFLEAIVKLRTKSADNPKRPDRIEAVKEFGDQQYRGFIHLMDLYPGLTVEAICELVSKHIEYKLGKLLEYHKDKKYIGGL